MQPGEIVEALRPWIERVTRPAWRPAVEEGHGPPAASKFSGLPWTGPEAPWPVCAACDAPMALLLQLRLDDLPGDGGRHGAGLLQFFYCSRAGIYACEADEAHVPFSDKATRVRIIRPIPQTEAGPAPPGYEPPEASPLRIVGWDRFDDRPDFHEFKSNGLLDDLDFATDTLRLRCPELGLDLTTPDNPQLIDAISRAATGDKLGGWPKWIQREEYPSCPRCGLRMTLVFQVDSHDHIRDGFGDFGTGHLTQCPEHKDIVAFGSAR